MSRRLLEQLARFKYPIWTMESSNALEQVSCGCPAHSRSYTRASYTRLNHSQKPHVESSIATVVPALSSCDTAGEPRVLRPSLFELRAQLIER